jgi:hypothetical protein
MHVPASMLLNGTPSTHRVDLSVVVSMYMWPSEETGRGPMRAGTAWNGEEWRSQALVDLSTLVMLAVAAHSCHVFAHTLPCRGNTFRLVAPVPGWATLWMAWKTETLSQTGTSSLVMPCATSQSRLAPSTWTVLTVREEVLGACSVLGQLAWLAAKGWFKDGSASILFYSNKPKGMLMAFFCMSSGLTGN